MSMDPVTGLFLFNGYGVAEGNTITGEANAGILAFDWHFTVWPPVPDSNDPEGCNDTTCSTCRTRSGGSTLSPATGELTEEVSTPGVRVLGATDRTTLVYKSLTAFPDVDVHWTLPLSLAGEGIVRLSVDWVPGGAGGLLPLTKASEIPVLPTIRFHQPAGVPLGSAGFMLAARIPAASLATGLHDHTFRTTRWARLAPDDAFGPSRR